jgi:glutamate 5-kinase
MRDFSHIKHLIVKVGSSSLCDEKGNIDSQRILGLVQQIAHIRQRGIQVTLVSSGAISAGMKSHEFYVKKPENHFLKKQALAAIGQASLMKNL